MIIDPNTHEAHVNHRSSYSHSDETTDHDDLAPRLADVHEQIERTARAYPYMTVAAAVGVGVVLGGGLPSWAARLLVMSGARVAAARWVDALLPRPR